MLWWVVNRVRRARLLDEVVVATTDRPEDDELEGFCMSERWACFRGSETDVLDRYHAAAEAFEAKTIVRITSDCPLIDPGVVDLVVATFRAVVPAVDYASNCQRRTYPRGLDTEVFSDVALEKSWTEGTRPDWREHVTPYLYRSGRFRLVDVTNTEDHSGRRWTVDTPEDLSFVRALVGRLGTVDFSWGDALGVELEHPEWTALNQQIRQKEISAT
jgi:spore coat polysaccharide biosynthesis protein SpsF